MFRFGIFLLSAAALVSGAAVRPKLDIDTKSPDGECPEATGQYPVYLGDTEDCTVFYECDWGRPIKQHCPPGTSWSSMNRCDTSEVDQCKNAQHKLKPRSAVGECPNPSGEFPVYLPDDEDCTVFYECSNGQPIKLKCAPGDKFDAPSGKCVKAADAHCQGSAPKNVQPLSAVGKCPNPSGEFPVYLPDDEDCTVFYECSNGQAIKLQCAPGDKFDAPSGKCVKAADAHCQGSAPKNVQPLSAVGKCPNPSGEFPVYLPDDEDCTVFYECSNGQAIKLQCAPGDKFDAPSGKCVKAADAHCQAKVIPTDAVGECPNPSGEFPVYLPDDKDCSIFYECSNGQPIKLQCAPGDEFDAPSGKCVKAEDAQCQGSSNSKIPKPKPLSVVGECPNPSGSTPVYLPDDKDCSAFYECSNGEPIQLFCAPGTLFDSVSRRCKRPTEAKCQNASN